MRTLEQAETAHFARLDAAYQRSLDDYDAGQAAADKALWLAETLQDLEDDGWELEHLEPRNGFDRYEVFPGITCWACPECASVHADPLTGCERCGWRTAEWYELFEEEAA